MRDGRIEQIGRPETVYREPATPFVAGFIGIMNLIEGTVSNGIFTRLGLSIPLPVSNGHAVLAVRPEELGMTYAYGGETARI